jgi:UDP-N-acetylmuramate--alanine ligase
MPTFVQQTDAGHMINVGIFFGGPSREREISFAGGRTVYDNLDKALFHPIPIFVDSHRRFIELDWSYIYKGTIRDFFPPVDELPPSPHHFQVYLESLGNLAEEDYDRLIRKVGTPLTIEQLPQRIDLAFLALHGEYGEDGQLQGLLSSLHIPYTGSGIRACAIGIDKGYQKNLMEAGGFPGPKRHSIFRSDWTPEQAAIYWQNAQDAIGFPMVVRPAGQGSSIGVSILPAQASFEEFKEVVDKAFFRQHLLAGYWQDLPPAVRIAFVRELTDIREGLGFPLDVEGTTLYHPEELLSYLDEQLLSAPRERELLLESHWSEQEVILESFLKGKEFSCIVVRAEDGSSIALPPTEIVKGQEVFDYRSKYMPGLSRKQTPIQLPDQHIQAIRKECERLFSFLDFQTYARIDGFIEEDGTIYLNDPNTTSGMLPSSFFFHQAAEIGLTPSQFLTFIIRASLQERIQEERSFAPFRHLLPKLDNNLRSLQQAETERKKIAVLLGGYSFERHISVESGRNIFEKLSSSEKYDPIPVFLSGKNGQHELYQLPINLLLKDNADDIRDKIATYAPHPVVEEIKQECKAITGKYASTDVVFAPRQLTYEELAELVDGVFIALHGRPGEDGQVQRELERVGLPYNGSDPASSGITINKYETLQLLRENGFTVTEQLLLEKTDWEKDREAALEKVVDQLRYPLIAKPVDDGCSSAVMVIREPQQLGWYLDMLFRPEGEERPDLRAQLNLSPREEFPHKDVALLEDLITADGAVHFLEITGGLLTHYQDGELRYEIFEPSEALAGGEVLSLEEKFLAGEGQNITPARFETEDFDYAYIAQQVKTELERVAQLLNVQGYARIDAFVRIFANGQAETIIVEVNSLPGMTPATCIYHQAAINGYKPYHFIDKILEFGFHERSSHTMVDRDR